MNVLLLVCDSFVKNTKYESYLKFFSGFLMMLCLLKPVIDLAGAGKYMDASYIVNQLKNEWDIIARSEDLQDMKQGIQEEYDAAIEEQVTDLGETYAIRVTGVRVRWEEDGSAMRELEVKGEEAAHSEGDTPQIHDFREALKEFYHLDTSQIDMVIGG